jgi:hypothetical protein
VCLSPAQRSLDRLLSRVLDAGGNRGIVEPVLLSEHAYLTFGHRMGRVFTRREPRIPGDLDEEIFRCASYYPKGEPICCHRSAFLGLRCVGTPRGKAFLRPHVGRCLRPPAPHALHEPLAQPPQAAIGPALAHGEPGPDLSRREPLRTREAPANELHHSG